MVYSRKMLIKIGKEVVSSHPQIACAIVDGQPKPLLHQLDLIPALFTNYCDHAGVTTHQVITTHYKMAFTEHKKIFIAAMLVLFGDKYRLNKCLSEVLDQGFNSTTVMTQEVRVRYRKDVDFNKRVTTFINTIPQ